MVLRHFSPFVPLRIPEGRANASGFTRRIVSSNSRQTGRGVSADTPLVRLPPDSIFSLRRFYRERIRTDHYGQVENANTDGISRQHFHAPSSRRHLAALGRYERPCGSLETRIKARIRLEIGIEIQLDFDQSKQSSLNLRLVFFLLIG